MRDLVDAAVNDGVKLGVVYEAPGHALKVIKLDHQGFSDTMARAAIQTLAAHVVTRYASVTKRGQAA